MNADDIEVFYGRITKNSAQVYARVTSLPGGSNWSLTGQVRGPFASGTRTLPMTTKLADLGSGPTLLSGGSIPDPATWTPLSPAHYKVTVELCREGELVASVERELGLRTLGTDGRNLRWEGKRWVLRGILVDEAHIAPLSDWREHAAVPILSSYTDTLLQGASDAGVLLAIKVGAEVAESELRYLARFPAVGVIVGSIGLFDDNKCAAIPNALLVQTEDSSPDCLHSAANLSLLRVESCSDSELATTRPHPIAVVRQLAKPLSFREARAACDDLQRDLASLGQFAGYIVDARIQGSFVS